MFKSILTSITASGAAAATVAILSVGTALAGDLSDAQILGIYSQVNSFDIETALLGELKGASEEVRGIGEMVSRDHTGVRAAAHDLAADLGVDPVLPPSRVGAARDHDEVILMLRGLDGAEFDAAYLRHEIAFHTAAIGAVETVLLPQADAPELKAHFKAILPAFEHHLKMNIDAAQTLGVSVEQ